MNIVTVAGLIPAAIHNGSITTEYPVTIVLDLTFIWASMVGAVCKISAFQPQGPQFDPGSAKICIFVRPSFLPKIN